MVKTKFFKTQFHKVNKTSSKTSKLTPQQKYWNQVQTQTHYLIADTLNQLLPLPNLRVQKNLDLEKDADYRTLLFEAENNYSQNLPDPKTLAEELTYEYLFLVVKSLLKSLSNFDYHLPDYFSGLTEIE